MILLDDDEVREAIEFDFLTVGVDLGDLYTDRLSLRRYRVLLAGLPATSRLHRIMRRRFEESGQTPTPVEDLPGDSWSTVEHLIATVVDKLEILTYIQLDPATRPSRPNFLPRPGVRRSKGAAAWFGALGLEAATT